MDLLAGELEQHALDEKSLWKNQKARFLKNGLSALRKALEKDWSFTDGDIIKIVRDNQRN